MVFMVRQITKHSDLVKHAFGSAQGSAVRYAPIRIPKDGLMMAMMAEMRLLSIR